jgi:hypothetical protein
MKLLIGAVLQAFGGMSVEDYETFLKGSSRPLNIRHCIVDGD